MKLLQNKGEVQYDVKEIQYNIRKEVTTIHQFMTQKIITENEQNKTLINKRNNE